MTDAVSTRRVGTPITTSVAATRVTHMELAVYPYTASNILDACNGITSPTPEFPGGVSHYVL